MPNNSPKLPPKSPRRPPYRTPHRLSLTPSSHLSPSSSSSPSLSSRSQYPPGKSPRLSFSVPSSPFNPANKSKNKKKKKKKSCYSSCCCIMFLGLIAFLFVFILQESWDPDGELAVKFMEAEVLQDITGPAFELPGTFLSYLSL